MKIWKKKEKEKRLQVYDDVECRRDDDGMIGSETESPEKLNWIVNFQFRFLNRLPVCLSKKAHNIGPRLPGALGLFLYWSSKKKDSQPIRMSSKNEEIDEIEFNVKTSSTSRSLPCISINISYRARARPLQLFEMNRNKWRKNKINTLQITAPREAATMEPQMNLIKFNANLALTRESETDNQRAPVTAASTPKKVNILMNFGKEAEARDCCCGSPYNGSSGANRSMQNLTHFSSVNDELSEN